MNAIPLTLGCLFGLTALATLGEERKPPVRFAIVGLVHDHARGFIPGALARTDIQLAGIVEPDQKLTAQYAQRYKLNTNFFYASLEELLAKTNVQAVAAFTSTFDHLRVVEACAPRGIHVMMEKPLATNLKHARAMEAAAKKGGIHLLVNYETTWYPANHAAYALVREQNTIGDVRKMVVHDGHRGPKEIGCSPEFLEWLTDPVLNGGGALTDFGCYGANLITWFMQGQRPTSVFAVTQQIKPDIYPKVDDEATIVLTYPKAQGIIQASWNWPYNRKDMEIYGQTGYVLVPRSNLLRTLKGSQPEDEVAAPPLAGPQVDPLSYLAAVVRGEIRSSGLSSLEVNMIAVEILDAARESASTGKRVDLRAAENYTNPVLAGDYPDPSVIRVGKEYWATATSSEWAPQFPLMRSTDLVNWEIAGSVFSNPPAWSVANYWAPEIAEHKGRYFIYYVGRKRDGPLALAVASADKPSGPYSDHGVLVAQDAGSIDGVPFVDEKGQRYLIWKEDGNSRRLPTIIWAQPLSEDGGKLLGEMKELIRNDAPWEGAVVEGPFIVRRENWFYLFYSGSGCCGTGCNYALGVARSRSLLGPWEKNPANPILAGNASWKCPGHGSIVGDEQGRYWLLYHAYSTRDSVFTGRQMLLDEVKFAENGWPTINDGEGPSPRAPSPLDAPQRRTEHEFTDTFDGPELRPGWNWPVGDNSPATLAQGKLVLRGQPAHATNVLGAVLGRSITDGDFLAATELDLLGLKPGVWAGLAAIGDRANATGIAVGDGKVIVWHRDKGKHQTLAEGPALKAATLRLRLTATGGQRYQFAYSSDGQNWTDIVAEASGKHLPPWDRAVRVALTVGGTAGAEARFDSLRVAPQRK